MTRYADRVFAGGRVFCADAVRRFATAVAVRDGRIMAVGHDEVRDLVGPDTEVVDLAGGLLTPGFQDAHVHPVQGGLERLSCDLSELTTREQYLDAIRAYADKHPDREWITGGGWESPAFPDGMPTRHELDAVVPDRPVFLPNTAHHDAWVNTVALKRAGVGSHTEDPADGRLARDADGVPSGTLHEGAMDLVGRLVPPATPEELAAGLLEAQRHLHSLGITAWQDAIIGEYANIVDTSAIYLEAARSGALTARVVGALWWERDADESLVSELVERRAALRVGRFAATSVKIMQDGVPENGTAAMLDPYLDPSGRVTDNRGLSFVDAAALRRYVTMLDAEGFQVHLHAIGDRAVREALDAFEAARAANGVNDHRHHIAHLQVIHPDDRPRFRELGVTANLQPLWAAYEPQMTDLAIPVLGPERSAWQYPFADLLATGATLACGSDWPVSSANPLWGMHVAVNRRLPPAAGQGEYPAFYPEYALDLATVMTAYTAGAAYLNHLDDTGVIAAGNRADLAVLDRDPFTGRADEIADARVVATYVDGDPVYLA
ncbi:MAG: amidohydrolase family protein [Propionibacteriales bacterium]|nr:amidohydrolase family protein [Propionibacteriales bacterium]